MALETVATLEVTGKGVGWLWKNVIKPYFYRAKMQRKEMLDKITNIHAELKFNGGTSIKDAIWELKLGMEKIDTRLNGIEENQHVAMNLQGLAFWVSNDKGECVYASTNLCKLVGRNEHDLMGNGWIAWVAKEDKERIFESWEFSVESKSAFDEYYTFVRADGRKQKVWGLAFHKKINGTHMGTMGKLEAIGEPF